MHQPRSSNRIPLPTVLLLHAAAAGTCFMALTGLLLALMVGVIVIENDPGGPMFLPIYGLGVLLGAGTISALLGSASLITELLRRARRVSLVLPATIVCVIAGATAWLFVGHTRPMLVLSAGIATGVAFLIYHSAITLAMKIIAPRTTAPRSV